MKKITLLACLLLGMQGIWAQDCDAIAPPYSLDFESAAVPGMPPCTTVETPLPGSSWVTAANPGNGFDSNVLQYSGNAEPANAWLFSRGIELTAGVFYKVTYKYGNNSGTAIESFKITMGNHPNVAAVTNNFADHPAVTGGTPTTAVVNYFNQPVSGIYYFGFNAYSAAGGQNLYIDDFIIEEMVCGMPANVQVTEVTNDSAVLSWETPENGNGGPVSVYQYAYSETNTPPADGTYNPALSVDLNGLDPMTIYYVFTRALCGPIWSDWTMDTFTTSACATAALPYELDFEVDAIPALPACTSADSGNGNDWETVSNPGSGFGSSTLQYAGNAEEGDAWFFTAGVELTEGTYYKVAYTYGNNSEALTESFRVTFGSSPNAASVIGNFAEHGTVTGGMATDYAVDYFVVPDDGIYYFGINAMSAASQGNLYIDNFSIAELVCGTPDNVEVTDITPEGATITWEAPVNGNASTVSVYQYAYGTDDTPPADGTYEPGFTTDLSGLDPETTYYVFTRTLCGPVWSDWTTTEFTTEAVMGTNNPTRSTITVYPNPVTDRVTVTMASAIDNIEVYNITGQLVHRQAANAQTAEINLEKLAAGAYLMNVSSGDGIQRVRIIKK